jgi:2-dehydro-3-deoxygluconokinase
MTATLESQLAGFVAVGECMIELSGEMGGAARLSYGGDTLNTAVYVARLGQPAAYVTALGLDPYSEHMLAAWRAEGLDVSGVARSPTHLPGLYAITTDARGERSFHYWRAQSAARALFALDGVEAALERARRARCLYLSGITLSLYDAGGRERLFALARGVRAAGGMVAFDPNYRPRGWPDASEARATFDAMAAIATVALPTHSDEAMLRPEETPEGTLARWRAAGVGEVVVKLGEEGALVGVNERGVLVPTVAVTPRDTTGAGDSFNAGYLAARLAGASPLDAAQAGHRLAGAVVMHPGAVIPREAMP